MDVLDPSFAPGVGNPEPNGISIEKLLEFFNILKGKKIVGFDIVEVCPPYDTGISSISAAKISKPIFYNENTSIEEITLDLNKWLEKMILANPDQWIWSHDRWK